MTHSYYDPGSERGAKVQALFDAIAPSYDLVNDLQSFGLHRYWKSRLVSLGQPSPGQSALDLCCGTGDLVFAWARREINTVGVDFSHAMLAVAARRLQAHRALAPRVTFVCGDAQCLPFADEQFDIVSVGYGLRNLAAWERGIDEMWRVAKPGGRLLILEFGRPPNLLWRSIYERYLRWVVPVFGRIFAGDRETYAYILESLQHYPAQPGVTAKLVGLAAVEIKLHNFLGGVMSVHSATKPK